MMKFMLYILTAGLVLCTGCSKEEKPAPAPAAPKETLSQQAQSVGQDLTKKAGEMTAKATEQVTAVAKQVKDTAQNISEKTQTVIKNFTVSKDDVMADLNQPVDALKGKVDALKKPELMAYANSYKDVLLEKKDQLAALTNQLKSLPMGDMLGAKGKEIKNQLTQYTTQFAGLKERYSVYIDKLKALGVNIPFFEL